MRLEFWFDFASTYSYPVAMRIEEVAARYEVPIAWNAFLLGPIFKAQGWNDSPFNIYPAKGEYMWRDMARICNEQAKPLLRRNTEHAIRLGIFGAPTFMVNSEMFWGGDKLISALRWATRTQ